MPAIGFGLAWGGYTGMLWAWCLLRGYNVTLGELVNPVHLLNWKTAAGTQIPDSQVMPGNAGASSSSSSPSAAPGPAPSKSGQGAPTGTTGSPVKPYG